MVMYNYERYQVIERLIRVKEEPKVEARVVPEAYNTTPLSNHKGEPTFAYNYCNDYETFYSEENKEYRFRPVGPYVNYSSGSNPPTGIYKLFHKEVNRLRSETYPLNSLTYRYVDRITMETAMDAKGGYMDSVVLDDSYPINGIKGGYWYVRKGVSNKPPTTPGPFTYPKDGTVLDAGTTYTIQWNPSTDPDGNAIKYSVGVYEDSVYRVLNASLTTPYMPYKVIEGISKVFFTILAVDSLGASGLPLSSPVFQVSQNKPPNVTLTTTDARTLYENDTYGISGNATDANSGDVVMVKYQINSGTVRTITSPISTGAAIPFNKVLTFKAGILYDGATAVTASLAEGSQHVLKVWAEDDKGGKSAEQSRTFYVVPNRPAQLTIEPFSQRTDLIDTDSVTIKGNVSDPDNNTIKVKYKIANGSFTEVYSGVGGPFSFPVNLANLVVGLNTLTIQATDEYGAVTSKTLQITKAENVQPLKQAVTRYKLTPPNGTAKGVVLWINREVGDLLVDAEISMTAAGAPEDFKKMTKSSTAFFTDGIEEDEFTYEAPAAVESIILKVTMTRTSTASDKGITLISGVLSS